jgi:predicted outer membrane repeat protein
MYYGTFSLVKSL